jgi:hypothetical protein
MSIAVLQKVTPFSLVGDYQRFAYVTLKRLTLNMEATRSSETSVTTAKTARRRNPEDYKTQNFLSKF